jgi:hypothetical protein
MNRRGIRVMAVTALLGAGLQLSGCGKKDESATQQSAPAAVAPAPAVAATEAPPQAVTAAASYSPEALETLLAPIALYPDPVLAQVLATSTNPQEVLDAGNWLVQNADLKGKELEAAAAPVGFTPPMMALIQFPTVVDMMCMEMDWTTEVGSAFLADEPGVLDAVQRLRKQAADMGNLQSSEQMKVTTEPQNNQQVIVVQPAQPEVVYVPQYEPAAVYTTPPPATAVATTPASTGHSTGTLVTTGLLSFGAGILVANIFDDDDDHDDDWDDYYRPRWGYGGSGYYPPPYRPRYGDGFRPGHNYNRPANYQHGFNNNNVYVNTGGKDYFNQFDGGRNNYRNKPNSPISAARPNRPELQELNKRTPSASRPAQPKVQGSYAGAKDRAAATRTDASAKPKVPSGTYAGAKPDARNLPKPQTAGTRDRGHTASRPEAPARASAKAAARPETRPAAAAAKAPTKRPSGLQEAQRSGKSERAASERGRASMPKGAQSSGKAKGQAKSGHKRGN